MATWPEWNLDTEWVRLDGEFTEGATGILKPKGGPKVRFIIERLEPGRRFTDVSLLFGARLTFDHRVSTDARGTHVAVEVGLDGPLAFFWRRILGRGIRASMQPDLDRLGAAVLESQAA